MSGNSESATFNLVARPGGSYAGRRRRRLSPFRALSWKEWREQRTIWLALLALSLGVGILARLAPERGEARELLLLAVPFLWAGMAILLGANAFAGESDGNTESFMAELPVSRQMRFRVKLLVVALLLWSAQALTVLFMPTIDSSASAALGRAYFQYHVYLTFALGMLFLSLTAACAASWSGNTLLIVFLTAVAGPCLVLWLAWLGRFLYATTGYLSLGNTGRWFALLTTLLLGYAVLCAGARWLWIGRRGGFGRRLGATAVVLALFALVPALPSAAGYIRATLAPPTFLQQRLVEISASPAGRYVLFNYWWPSWLNNERTVLVDAETGRALRLTRLRSSEIARGGWMTDGTWSPDGARFLLYTSEQWTFPFDISSYGFPWWIPNAYREWSVDAARGTRQYVRSFSAYPYQRSWWWDDHTVAFHAEKGIVFQDIASGAQRVCADPVVDARTGEYSLNGNTMEYRPLSEVFRHAAVSAAGIWVMLEVPDAARSHSPYLDVYFGHTTFYCYGPHAAAATAVKSDLQLQGAFLDEVSPDGRWALVLTYVYRGEPRRVFLCSLETGKSSEVPRQYAQFLPAHQRLFTRDSKALLVRDEHSVGLFDISTRKLDVLYAPRPPYWVTGYPKLSPSGKYVLLNLGQDVNMGSVVVEIATKSSRVVATGGWMPGEWLGDDEFVAYLPSDRFELKTSWETIEDGAPKHYSLWVVSRDGATKRKVLP